MHDVSITDEKLGAVLGSSEHPVTIRGADGKMIGYFTPLKAGDLQPQISDEEIARRFADKTSPTHTTAEVLKHLERQNPSK